jgi:hypothetical protein
MTSFIGTVFTQDEAVAAAAILDEALEAEEVWYALRQEPGRAARVDKAMLILLDYVANAVPAAPAEHERGTAA